MSHQSKKFKRVSIDSVEALGELIRQYRKDQHFTLEQVTGMSGIGMRFLSELERGKETAQLGKTLAIIKQLGLEIIIQQRGTDQHKLT